MYLNVFVRKKPCTWPLLWQYWVISRLPTNYHQNNFPWCKSDYRSFLQYYTCTQLSNFYHSNTFSNLSSFLLNCFEDLTKSHFVVLPLHFTSIFIWNTDDYSYLNSGTITEHLPWQGPWPVSYIFLCLQKLDNIYRKNKWMHAHYHPK